MVIFQNIPHLDRIIVEAISSTNNFFLDQIMVFVSYVGEYGAIWIFIALAVLFIDKNNGKKIFLLMMTALLIEITLNDGLLKHLFYRQRPYFAIENLRYLGFLETNSSFVSGHMASTVATSIVLAKYYKKWHVPLVLFAIATGYSRIYLGMHYLSDVIAGLFVGILSAVISLKFFVTKNR